MPPQDVGGEVGVLGAGGDVKGEAEAAGLPLLGPPDHGGVGARAVRVLATRRLRFAMAFVSPELAAAFKGPVAIRADRQA